MLYAVDLLALVRLEDHGSDAAEEIRDRMDVSWRELSAAERESLRHWTPVLKARYDKE